MPKQWMAEVALEDGSIDRIIGNDIEGDNKDYVKWAADFRLRHGAKSATIYSREVTEWKKEPDEKVDELSP